MKRALAFLLALIMVMSFAACGDTKTETKDNPKTETTEKKEDTKKEEAKKEEAEKVLKVAMTASMGDLDPFNYTSPGANLMRFYIYEYLAVFSEFGQSWEDMSWEIAKDISQVDDTTYKIEIYDYIVDAAGNKITAEDVVYCFHTMRDNGQWSRVTQYVNEAVAVDDYTVELKLNSDVVGVLEYLMCQVRILPACDVVKFQHDTSVSPPNAASLHSVNFIPASDFCVVTSIKHDKVFMFRLDRERKRLFMCDVIDFPSGYWPRHSAVHHNKNVFYLNNEHSLHLTAVAYDDKGKMDIIQQLDVSEYLAPDEYEDEIMQSDLKISRDGRYLYALCRGSDMISVFRIDESGLLVHNQSVKLTGCGPRGMEISPDNRWVFVALQRSGLIAKLKIFEDGSLGRSEIVDDNMSSPGNICFVNV